MEILSCEYNIWKCMSRDIQILEWIIKYNTFAVCQAEKADKK